MKPLVTIPASLMLLVLAGCGAANYDVARTALQGSPGLRSQTISNCVGMMNRKPLSTRRNMATVMNISVRKCSAGLLPAHNRSDCIRTLYES